MTLAQDGSSPLTRGKHSHSSEGDVEEGLIPTHAGKTGAGQTGKRLEGAHPHSRGENSRGSRTWACPRGSSPLTRGKRFHRDEAGAPVRLIPTHAGKTGFQASRWGARRAHPHSRGENFARVPVGKTCAGSSPLTRGKHATSVNRRVEHGLIPTHAGKTSAAALAGGERRAHPHSRGENKVIGQGYDSSWGSSPLTRGKHSR